jgi:hypothetical protein
MCILEPVLNATILFKVKPAGALHTDMAGEIFNHRNTLSVLRIKSLKASTEETGRVSHRENTANG